MLASNMYFGQNTVCSTHMTKNSVIPFVWVTLPFLPPLAREQIELILLLLSSSPLSLSHAVLSFVRGRMEEEEENWIDDCADGSKSSQSYVGI